MKEADSPRPAGDNTGLALLILVLVLFLAISLLFFGSGWLQVDLAGSSVAPPA